MSPTAKCLRNGLIDVLRLLFSLIVVSHHASYLPGAEGNVIPLYGGYTSVEFFAILSGYLLSASAWKKSSFDSRSIAGDTLLELKRKLLSVYPLYLLSYFLLAIIDLAFLKGKSLSEMLEFWAFSAGEWTLLGMAGFHHEPLFQYGFPMWYFSALLLSVPVLYPLMRRYKYIFPILFAPIIALFGYGYMFVSYGHLSHIYHWTGYFYSGILRVVCGVSVGNIVFHVVRKVKYRGLSDQERFVCSCFQGCILFFILWCMEHYHTSYRDFLFIFAFALLIGLAFISVDGLRLFHHSCFHFCGNLSKTIYISHSMLLWIPSFIWPLSWKKQYLLYMGMAIILGVIFISVEKQLLRLLYGLKSYCLSKK